MGIPRCAAAWAAITFSFASTANAVPPQVTGKYAYLSQNFCEAKLTLTRDAQSRLTNVVLTQAGMFSGSVGYINFNPTSATGGNATITGSTLIEGGSLRIANNGFNWTQGPDNSTAQPYSFTNTTFNYAGEVYRMVYAEPGGANGFFRTVYLVRRFTSDGGNNPNCLQTIWATKQPDDGT